MTRQQEIEALMAARSAAKEQKVKEDYDELFYGKKELPCNPREFPRMKSIRVSFFAAPSDQKIVT